MLLTRAGPDDGPSSGALDDQVVVEALEADGRKQRRKGQFSGHSAAM